jgi:AhpD family alkylhydroperoxidase
LQARQLYAGHSRSRSEPIRIIRFVPLARHGSIGAARAWREETDMPRPQPIEYAQASEAVRAVFDDIKTSRNVPDVNNFWKYVANDEKTLRRTWESVKEVMAPGALDPLVKELIYVAVSVTNNCGYCIASHSAAAAKAGMTDAQFGELLAVVGMANETNRLANGYRVPLDPAFET